MRAKRAKLGCALVIGASELPHPVSRALAENRLRIDPPAEHWPCCGAGSVKSDHHFLGSLHNRPHDSAYLAIVDEPIAVTGQDDAAKAEWFPLSALPELAFDHADIMQDAVKAYKAYLSQGFSN